MANSKLPLVYDPEAFDIQGMPSKGWLGFGIVQDKHLPPDTFMTLGGDTIIVDKAQPGFEVKPLDHHSFMAVDYGEAEVSAMSLLANDMKHWVPSKKPENLMTKELIAEVTIPYVTDEEIAAEAQKAIHKALAKSKATAMKKSLFAPPVDYVSPSGKVGKQMSHDINDWWQLYKHDLSKHPSKYCKIWSHVKGVMAMMCYLSDEELLERMGAMEAQVEKHGVAGHNGVPYEHWLRLSSEKAWRESPYATEITDVTDG